MKLFTPKKTPVIMKLNDTHNNKSTFNIRNSESKTPV